MFDLPVLNETPAPAKPTAGIAPARPTDAIRNKRRLQLQRARIPEELAHAAVLERERPVGQKRVHVVTLGCSKNTVDSELLIAQLKGNDFVVAGGADDADVVVVNTCGFIEAAKQESIDTILAATELKAQGKLSHVFVTGCLAERYKGELEAELPEVDRIFGVLQLPEILGELGGRYRRELLGERTLTGPTHSAFLKISEGCDHPCAFCAIPLMRGHHVSRSPEDVVSEAYGLARQGVRELSLIAQDLTYYGLDRTGKRTLADLVGRVADVPGIDWVRLMYAYPAQFPLDLLDVIADHPNVCKYLDMPVQHGSDAVLKHMRRGMTRERTEALLQTIRDRVPGIALRTSVIVGYPAETRAEFEQLLDFVKTARFDRLGVFTYSVEDDTAAYPLGDTMDQAEKDERAAELMELQRTISAEKNAARVGQTERVLIDRIEGEFAVGRTERDAPEVDNEVLVDLSPAVRVGEFVQVEVTDAAEYDLFARVVS